MHGTVAILTYPGVDELDVVGVLSPLRKAASLFPLEVLLLSPGGEPVRTSGGVVIRADGDFSAALSARTVVIPGGRGAASAPLADIGPALERARDKATLFTVCTGLLLLARAELLRESPVSFHHAKSDMLRDTGYVGEIVEGVVRHPALVTVAGRGLPAIRPVVAAFEILGDIADPAVVESVASRMELDDALPLERVRNVRGA